MLLYADGFTCTPTPSAVLRFPRHTSCVFSNFLAGPCSISEVGDAAGAEPTGVLDELDMLAAEELELSPGGGVSAAPGVEASPLAPDEAALMLFSIELPAGVASVSVF